MTAIAEVIAITEYVSFWWPDLPLWVAPTATVALLLGLNLTTVQAFGEIEFWFSIIKIVAIIALVVIGIVMVAVGFHSPGGVQASVANLWNGGDLFPNGFHGFVGAFQIAVFAFVGTELIGTAAAEAKDPEVTLPRAINAIPVRIVLFYLGALAAIMAVTPWQEINPKDSPFVAMFAWRASAWPPASSTSWCSRPRRRRPTPGSTPPPGCSSACPGRTTPPTSSAS